MEKKLVLIVDDEKSIIEHVSSILKYSGLEVISSERGEEALRLAEERKPDLIILDINLPDIDGGELANRLSQKEETKNIPIIYLTGLVTKEEREEPQKAGRHFLIAKPVLKGELLSLVSKALAES